MTQWRSSTEIRADREDVRALKAAHRDPADLEKRAAINKVRWEQIKAGRLPAWEWVRK